MGLKCAGNMLTLLNNLCKFPKRRNREFVQPNREFSRDNRETASADQGMFNSLAAGSNPGPDASVICSVGSRPADSDIQSDLRRFLGPQTTRIIDHSLGMSSSPWMRGAPHNGFSRLIRWMSSRISFEVRGRPGLPWQDFQFQNRRNGASQ